MLASPQTAKTAATSIANATKPNGGLTASSAAAPALLPVSPADAELVRAGRPATCPHAMCALTLTRARAAILGVGAWGRQITRSAIEVAAALNAMTVRDVGPVVQTMGQL